MVTNLKVADGDQCDDTLSNQKSGIHAPRTSIVSTSSTSTINNGTKRQKDVSPCYVCGAKAHGYNFDQSNKIKKTEIYISIDCFGYSHL